MEQRTAYRSSFRNFRAPVKSSRVAEVGGPAGAGSSTTAQDQAEALRKRGGGGRGRGGASFMGGPGAQGSGLPSPPPPSTSILPLLPKEIQAQIVGGYGSGGFEGVTNNVGPEWYDIPDFMRTDILKQVSGR